jgi:hypothetical protein
VALKVKLEDFWDLLIDTLSKANRISCLNTESKTS